MADPNTESYGPHPNPTHTPTFLNLPLPLTLIVKRGVSLVCLHATTGVLRFLSLLRRH